MRSSKKEDAGKKHGIFLKDPVSDSSLEDPVIIVHPRIAPIIYSRSTVEDAASKKELSKFGITTNNLKSFIQPDKMTQALIKLMREHDDGRLTYKELSKSYTCPISLEFPYPDSIFLATDGEVYQTESLFGAMKNSPKAPTNRYVINPE